MKNMRAKITFLLFLVAIFGGCDEDSAIQPSIVDSSSSYEQLSSSAITGLSSSLVFSSSSNISFDSLPIDTAMAFLNYSFYRPVDSTDNRKAGVDVVDNLYYFSPDGMCYMVKSDDGYSHGTFLDSYAGLYMYLMINGDSLFLGRQESCVGHMWGDCTAMDSYDGYYHELVLNDQVVEHFYYADYPKYKKLLQIDSTHIRIWTQNVSFSCWADAYIKESSIAEKINCDSLYIEKYNLIITETDWIFENETCRSSFATRARQFLSSEACAAYVDDINNISDCKKRNLNATDIPTLCSGTNDVGWCINYQDSTFINF